MRLDARIRFPLNPISGFRYNSPMPIRRLKTPPLPLLLRLLPRSLSLILGGLALACTGPATPAGVLPEGPEPAAATAAASSLLPAASSPELTALELTASELEASATPTPIPTPALPLTPPAEAAVPNLPNVPVIPNTPVVPAATGMPAPTPTPVAKPTPTPTVATPLPAPVGRSFPPAPERDLFQLAAELTLPPGAPPAPRVVNPEPVNYAAGRMDDFWLVDLQALRVYRSRFELRLVSPRAYWYVEEGQGVRQSDLERAAAEFEAVIYPRVTAYFGQEWTPGVDNDPHLTIVHGAIRGAAGYFSSTDEYPVSIRPRSNQREMIYINSSYLRVGSDFYLEVLAHELKHAIQWNYDTSEDSWVSEGLAELAVTVAGYQSGSMRYFMQRPFISLVHWPLDDANISAHYGGASLFMHYLAEHYGGKGDGGDASGDAGASGLGSLRQLVTRPEDNIAGIDAYLAEAGYAATFHTVFRDWVAANFLDETPGLYGYAGLPVLARESMVMNRLGQLDREVAQYGTHYIELGPELRGRPLRFRFEGAAQNSLLPTEVAGGGCWWSNSGDSITSSLTRPLDLRGLTQATLTYQVWYSIEAEWDYGYLQVSEDGGRHWDILEAPHTSAANPIGAAFGPGYTGKSKGWLEERVDLSGYAGQEILLRFQYVTDDALNDIGLCLRQIALPEAGISAGADDGWQPNGFILTDNRVPQDYIVQIIQKGEANRVTALPLSGAGAGTGLENGAGVLAGEVVVQPYPGLKRTVVAVSATAPRTRLKAPYKLSVAAAGQ